jgi:hypothetical protein
VATCSCSACTPWDTTVWLRPGLAWWQGSVRSRLQEIGESRSAVTTAGCCTTHCAVVQLLSWDIWHCAACITRENRTTWKVQDGHDSSAPDTCYDICCNEVRKCTQTATVMARARIWPNDLCERLTCLKFGGLFVRGVWLRWHRGGSPHVVARLSGIPHIVLCAGRHLFLGLECRLFLPSFKGI